MDEFPKEHLLEIRGKTYSLISYGLMSYRQYFDAREDQVIDEVLHLKWNNLAYIGASYGLQAMILSNYGKVMAFEPIKCIYDAMCQNIKANNVSVIPIMVGLSDINGLLNITHDGHMGATPSVNIDGKIKETIQVINFSNPIFNCVDFLFIDIEGAEIKAFHNDVRISKTIKNIIIEMHYQFYNDEKAQSIIGTLKRNGFKKSKKLYTRGMQEHILFSK